jgi:hypothetical protein
MKLMKLQVVQFFKQTNIGSTDNGSSMLIDKFLIPNEARKQNINYNINCMNIFFAMVKRINSLLK